MAERHESDHKSAESYLEAVENRYRVLKSESELDRTAHRMTHRAGAGFLADILDRIDADDALRRRFADGLPADLPIVYGDVVAGHLEMWEADWIFEQEEHAALLSQATAEVDAYLASNSAAHELAQLHLDRSPSDWQLKVLTGDRATWVQIDGRTTGVETTATHGSDVLSDIPVEPIAEVG